MNEAQIAAERRQKDEFFRTHAQSPLTPAQQAAFTALRYFPYNPALDLILPLNPFSDIKVIPVQTTTGTVREYQRVGEITFMVGDEMARLTVYEADYGFFLPFVDALAGTETYPAGRYLEPEELGGDRLHVDFNRAYSPYCAYGPDWSCPITPAENRLTVALRAGEMLPEGAWVGLE
jgi:uncharacterized protein (DUF1684 family)